jgi:rubrerythrin
MSTSGIDFAGLSLKDALDLAILIEVEARERYQEFAHQMRLHHTPEAAEFFAAMAGYEARHGEELAERRERLFPGEPRTVREEMLFDVEAPDYDQARAFMTARQAMAAALASERKAHAFFVDALPTVANAEVKLLFEELRDEEVHHQQLVERELARLPPDPGLDAEHFVDEPVGH